MKLHNVHRQLVVKTVLASQTWRLAQTRAEGFFPFVEPMSCHLLKLVVLKQHSRELNDPIQG